VSVLEMVLQRDFYVRPTLKVAHDLIGSVLVHESHGGITAGMIVEVEAYIGEADPACHAATGFSDRNAPLYGPPGSAYVYLSYGVHNLFNVVTEPEGMPSAVLIRAVEPLEGLDLMRDRRLGGKKNPKKRIHETLLCCGPGNLTRAMGINLKENRTDLSGGRLFIQVCKNPSARSVVWSRRIGISAGVDALWRCYIPQNQYVSG